MCNARVLVQLDHCSSEELELRTTMGHPVYKPTDLYVDTLSCRRLAAECYAKKSYSYTLICVEHDGEDRFRVAATVGAGRRDTRF